MKKFTIVFALCAFILTGFLLGCSGDRKGGKTGEKGLPLVITSMHPCYNSVAMDIADKNGYFNDSGIDTEIQIFSTGAPQNEALAAGRWDIGMLGMASALSSIRYGAKIIAVADYEGAAISAMVRPESELLNYVDFDENNRPSFKDGIEDVVRGKTIITTVGTSGHYSAQTMLEAIGLTFDDVQVLNMDQPSVIAAFKAGQGDIAFVWAPYTWPLEDEGFISINDIAANGYELPAVIMVRDEFYENEENKDAILAWLDAFLKATDEMKADDAVAIQKTKEYLNDQGYTPSDKQLQMEVFAKPIFSLEEQLELFDPLSGKDGMGDLILQYSYIADYLIGQGAITPEEKKYFIENSFTDEFLQILADKK